MLYLDWRFFPVFDQIDPTAAFSGTYNAGLVTLSVIVATLAAFVALSISGRIVAANSHAARWAWASAGAIAMGGGIWSMHFIGMLAFSLPCGVTYAPIGTVLSMIPGILASGVALHAISQRTDPGFKRLAVGGVLILMDCEMPVMDGFDATRRMRDIERVMRGLRDEEPSRSRTPIVALTAHALAEVRERCLEAGMDDFLVKPYDELQIADMLGRWLTPRAAIACAPEIARPSLEEQPAPAAVTTRLDMKAVDRIRRIAGDGGTSLLGQVVSQFAATSAPLLETMRAKSRDLDSQAVWRAAHGLRSSASAIGACRVSQYCEEIEARAKDNGILPAEALLAELETEVAAAISELKALLHAEQGAV
jgi:CheY-like chemotaxis protein/HPt (histidine-containing phosphotransfer) domain-containing protein